MTDRRVGIMGLGLLGGAISARLVEQGFTVMGFDIDSARRAAAEAGGVAVVADAAKIVDSCDIVLLSLPNGDISGQMLDKLGPHLRRGQIVVETTTAAPEQMKAHAEILRARGVSFVEAEVAGSSVQVRRGEALVFAGGDPGDVTACRTLLAALAVEVHYAGPCGSAAQWKLVHNLILGLHRAVLAEGLALADALGLDAPRLLEVLKRSPAASNVMSTKGNKMLARDFAPQATVRQHLKDVRLILATAAKCDLPLPLSQLHERLLMQTSDLGFAEADNSAVIMALLKPTQPGATS